MKPRVFKENGHWVAQCRSGCVPAERRVYAPPGPWRLVQPYWERAMHYAHKDCQRHQEVPS